MNRPFDVTQGPEAPEGQDAKLLGPAPKEQGPRKQKPFLFQLYFLLPLVVPCLLLILWQALCDHGVFRSSYLPSPLVIGKTFLDLVASGELWRNLRVSFLRVLEGFALGAGLGTVLGLTMGLSSRMERALSLLTGLLRPVPTIAWIPLLILWLGIGEGSKVVVIAVGSFWPVLLNVIQGVRGTDP
ncbi:MAG TPA: hypothetical protein VK859_01470, partial [bacterium]|nr:hypothetical protein [bacterium]